MNFDGKWTKLAPLRTPRLDFACAAANNYLYVIGGRNQSSDTLTEYYDPAADAWRAAADMPEFRYGLTATASGQYIYCVGGRDRAENCTDTVFIYDDQSDTWGEGTPMPEKLWRHGAVCHEDKLYVAGGLNLNNTYNDKLYIYDIKSDSWASGTDMPITAGFMSAAVAIDESLYFIGDDPNSYLVLLVYNTTTQTWLLFERGVRRAGRYSSLGKSGDNLYLCSVMGSSPSHFPHLEHYNREENSWQRSSALPMLRASTNNGIHGTALNGELYCIGNDQNESYCRDVYKYTPEDSVTITYRYHSEIGATLRTETMHSAMIGESYSAKAPAIYGYTCIGHRIDGGTVSASATANIPEVQSDHTITFVYREGDDPGPNPTPEKDKCPHGRLRLSLDLPICNNREILGELTKLVAAAKGCDCDCENKNND